MNLLSILRMAGGPLGHVLSNLFKQNGVVQEQAFNPIRGIIQQVTNGVWRGEGANAFVEELSTLMVPGVNRVSDHIQVFSNNLQTARDKILQADQKAEQLIRGQLFDAFKFYA